MWSVLPTEPPPQETAPGSAFSLATRSSIVWIGESTGTTTISYSPTIRASGVTWSRVTGALLVMIAPCRVWPATRIVSPLPLLGGHELREADRAAGAGDVLDLDAGGEPVLLQHGLHGAGGLVPAAARVGRCDQLSRSISAEAGPASARAPSAAAARRRRMDVVFSASMGSSLIAVSDRKLLCLPAMHRRRSIVLGWLRQMPLEDQRDQAACSEHPRVERGLDQQARGDLDRSRRGAPERDRDWPWGARRRSRR